MVFGAVQGISDCPWRTQRPENHEPPSLPFHVDILDVLIISARVSLKTTGCGLIRGRAVVG